MLTAHITLMVSYDDLRTCGSIISLSYYPVCFCIHILWCLRYNCDILNPPGLVYLCNGFYSGTFHATVTLDKLHYHLATYGNPDSPMYQKLTSEFCLRVSVLCL